MKIYTIILTILIPFIGISQSRSDSIISTYIVGNWEHVQSVFPSGNVSKYYQEFIFKPDGSGYCIQIFESDTIVINVEWEVKDTCVFLYTVYADGTTKHGDTVFISHLDNDNFFGDKVYGPLELRKTCFYKRKIK